MRGAGDEDHGAGIDVVVLERDIGIVLRDRGDDFAPEAGTSENVGFIDGENLLAAAAG